ncbi:unnamed protein product [Didymodactylos carnosus]|uniref:Kinesin light chain n=2 Tax=Didymodactylos carnosus TaxID=1234261 RepID=A0A815K5X5_9BILA|nr:unnamed protein product [Didymodactylos carnosus]CAF4285797.1 unnamed protein product [Didymodactylos carnosus]
MVHRGGALSFLYSLKSLPANHPVLAARYNHIAAVYAEKGAHDKALENYEKALEIRLTSIPSNHPTLATTYSEIGAACAKKGAYDDALDNYEKALEISLTSLPSNIPALPTSYTTALEISLKSLASNHPLLAAIHNHIGSVYAGKHRYHKALENYGKTSSYDSMALVDYVQGDHVKALISHEKARGMFFLG